MYVDDVGLVKENQIEFTRIIILWENVLEEYGWKLNLINTEFLVTGREQEQLNIIVEGVAPKQVTNATHLEITYNQSVSHEGAIGYYSSLQSKFKSSVSSPER